MCRKFIVFTILFIIMSLAVTSLPAMANHRAEILVNRGDICMERGDYIGARDYYNNALYYDPYNNDAAAALTLVNSILNFARGDSYVSPRYYPVTTTRDYYYIRYER